MRGIRPLLPDDFDRVLNAALRGGLVDQPPRVLERRARAAIAEAASTAGSLDAAEPATWAARILAELEAALHMELCRPNGDGLKSEYADVFDRALTREGITELAALILRLARAIAPAIAVSTVALYVAMWLLKIGLNRWCAVRAGADKPDKPKSRPRSGTPSRRGKRGRRAA